VDVALLCQVDQYLPDRVAYFRKLLPSLRPRGRLVLVNYLEFRAADLAAAHTLGLKVIDEWQPSPGFFMMVLTP